MRRIMVGVKRVVDYNVRVRVKPDNTGVITEGVKMSLNPFDEIALEEALRIKEKGLADEVLAVSIGPADTQQQLRTALAMGADRALLLETGFDPEPLAAAKALAALVRRESPDLVLMGRQSTDHDHGQTPAMLAGLLGWPQALQASQLQREGRVLQVRCDDDRGSLTVRLDLPAVVSAELRLCEPRYASLPAVMKAKKKPIEQLEPQALGLVLEPAPRLRPLAVQPPPSRASCRLVGDAATLVQALRDDARVL